MAALRDPDGFARLRAVCDSDPAVSKAARSRTLRRAAVILAARGGTLAAITIGDVLELLDTEAGVHGAATKRQRRLLPAAAPDGDLRPGSAGAAAPAARAPPASARRRK